jgi:hypothetical protein
MDPNHLHIWPRHSFMLIGLPNRVGSRSRVLASSHSRTNAPCIAAQLHPSE